MSQLVKKYIYKLLHCSPLSSVGLISKPLLFCSLFYAANSFAIDDGTWIYEIDGNNAGITGCVNTCPSELVIPNTIEQYNVTSIGADAFFNQQLVSVIIPNGVKSIGENAFRGNQLDTVIIPDSVISIEALAFFSNKITSLIIPNSVTSIGEYAFTGNQISSVTIPDGITSISNGVFSYNQLTSVSIPSRVTSIGELAFAVNQLNTVVIPDGVINIERSTFAENQLTTVSFPDSVIDIGEDAFSSNQLTSVVVGNNVTNIGKNAFSNNMLSSLIIPDGVTKLGERAFYRNLLVSITIPDSVISIGRYAFHDNQLTTLTIGNGVTEIAEYAFLRNQLTSVNVPDGVTSIGQGAFLENQISNLTIANSVNYIGPSAFSNNQLTSLTIPRGVTIIYPWAFDNNQLTSISIHENVTDIRYQAFALNALSTVQFFGDRPTIDSAAFFLNELNSTTYCSDTSGWPGDPIENTTPIDDCDNDGLRNDLDSDDDNDTVADLVDAFPRDPNESEDTDSDGIGNNADLDDDGDGIPDDVDSNPLIFDDVLPGLYTGQLHVLVDINDDGVAEIGLLYVDLLESKVRLEILDGKTRMSLDEVVWTDNFSDVTLSLHIIPDMNNNGADEVGLFGIQDIPNNEGKPQMFVRDLKTGNKVGSVYNWVANWTEVSALVLDDISGDGLSEMAIQGRFFEGGRPQLVVKIGNTNTILDTFSYPDLFVSPQYSQHSDISGDGFAEVATFGRLLSNDKIQVKIANGLNSADKMRAYNFPDKWDNISWHRLDDSNGDGQDDWGLFGTNREDGRPQLINKDGVSPQGALRIFAWPDAILNAQFFRIPDMNNDGVDEVAAAGRRSNNDRYQFQIQDGTDRNAVLANHNLNLNLQNVRYHVLPDLSGDGKVEIGFMGINPSGEYELVVQHGDSANGNYATHNLGSEWQSAPSIISLGDTDDDGSPDLLIYGQDTISGLLVITEI